MGDATGHPLGYSVTVDAGDGAQVLPYQFTRNGTPYALQPAEEVALADGTRSTVTRCGAPAFEMP